MYSNDDLSSENSLFPIFMLAVLWTLTSWRSRLASPPSWTMTNSKSSSMASSKNSKRHQVKSVDWTFWLKSVRSIPGVTYRDNWKSTILQSACRKKNFKIEKRPQKRGFLDQPHHVFLENVQRHLFSGWFPKLRLCRYRWLRSRRSLSGKTGRCMFNFFI